MMCAWQLIFHLRSLPYLFIQKQVDARQGTRKRWRPPHSVILKGFGKRSEIFLDRAGDGWVSSFLIFVMLCWLLRS